MIAIGDITEKLSAQGPVDQSYIKETANQTCDLIRADKLKIVDLVLGLNPILINGHHEVRLKGVEFLVQIITSLPKSFLNEKEIESLTEFLFLRLIDHKTMELSALRCLSYFVDCENKPARFNKNLLEFLKTKTNIQKMDVGNRFLIYEITRKIIIERHQRTNTLDSDLTYSLVHIIEGESNPQNLMLCFAIVSYVLKNFEDLEPYIDDLFEWLSSYYPIDYTPNEKDGSEGVNILRLDLVQALYDCFYANQLNSDNLQTLLLEKLESNVLSTKLESLECLTKCYEVFTLSSIKDYSSSLWTAIRVECLKKDGLVEPKLLETSYRALSALTKKLSEDDDIYFNFISDLYEELSIAIRKPEMDLFCPAAALLSNAVQPKLLGFNYILGKMLQISNNAIAANELRPLPGLAYIFEQLLLHHPGSKLDEDLSEPLNTLVVLISKLDSLNNCNPIRLLKALINFKVDLKRETLDSIIGKLFAAVEEPPQSELEECLALICIHYDRSDILFNGEERDCQISSLVKLITFYELPFEDSVSVKFSIYLRQLILLLDAAQPSMLNARMDQKDLNGFLVETRSIAIRIKESSSLVENIAVIHAIIINKLDNETVNPILMDFFGSNFCQGLVPNDKEGATLTRLVYLPVIKWILKALVVRNHQLSAPLTNLLLNFITSEKVTGNLALVGSQILDFIHRNHLFDRKRHYQVFALHKQKFYTQANNEIKIRYDSQCDGSKKNILICALAHQIPHIPSAVFRKDFEWLLRQLLIVLTNLQREPEIGGGEELILALFNGLESLIQADVSENLCGLISSLVDLTLDYATKGNYSGIRKRALVCLSRMATSFKESELLVLRSNVINRLKPCLEDKKRLVRQAAAETRLKWIIIGQPIGS